MGVMNRIIMHFIFTGFIASFTIHLFKSQIQMA